MVKQKINGGPNAKQRFLPFSVEENMQFSLGDEGEEETRPMTSDSRHELLSNGESSSSRNVTSAPRSALSSDGYRHPTWRASDSNKNKATENRDDIRLTDEIELNGDSDSEDILDLLPPLPAKHSTSKLRKRIQKIFVCCPSKVSKPKCTIM